MKIYTIDCRTGCSCCSSENHELGYFETKLEAESRIARFLRGQDYPLASQYAQFGRYSVSEIECEKITTSKGERYMLDDDKVIEPFEFCKIDLLTGAIISGREEKIYEN